MKTTMGLFPYLRAIAAAALMCAPTVLILAPAAVLAQPAPETPAAGAPAAGAPAAEAPAEPKAEAPKAEPKAEAPAAPAEKLPEVGGAGPTEDAYGNTDESVPLGGRLEWARRREIRVIQKRDVLKEGRHAFTIQSGVVPNDDFFVYPLVGGGYQYFFSEDLALDVHGVYAFENSTGLKNSLEIQRQSGGPGLEVRLPQVLKAYATAGVDWYLLHGKFGFFGTHLTEFDLSLNFGVGAVQTKISPVSGDAYRKYDAAGEVGADLMFYLARNWALRLGYRQNFYSADGGGVSFPISTTLAVTYFTAAPQ